MEPTQPHITGPELAELRRLRLQLSEPPALVFGYEPGEFERQWKAQEDRERELASRTGAPSWLPGKISQAVGGIGLIVMFVGMVGAIALVGVAEFCAAGAYGSIFTTPTTSPQIASQLAWAVNASIVAAAGATSLCVGGFVAGLSGLGLYSRWKSNQERAISEWEKSPEGLAYRHQLQMQAAEQQRKWDREVAELTKEMGHRSPIPESLQRSLDIALHEGEKTEHEESQHDSDDLEMF